MILQFKNISLLKNKQHILKNINWEVKKGEHWVILGANGSGKTMMLKMLSGYIWPSEGEIFVLGKKFGEVDLSTLRQTIGWVSFDLQTKMPEITTFEVVLSGYFASIGLYQKPTDAVSKKAEGLIRFVGLKEHKDNLFSLLSYGEQKKVLIARSLMNKPKLLLLDEPCSGLDMRARKKFLGFIEKIAKMKSGPTIIFVTHHIKEIVPGIKNVLALKKGKIIKMGKKEEILTAQFMKDIY